MHRPCLPMYIYVLHIYIYIYVYVYIYTHSPPTGGGDVPGLSQGNVNRNLSLVNSLHDQAFDALVLFEGWSIQDMHKAYFEWTGTKLDESEGTTNFINHSCNVVVCRLAPEIVITRQTHIAYTTHPQRSRAGRVVH
jgi:hypothetical protein